MLTANVMLEEAFAPIEMLLACHEKVRRFANLMLKLAAYTQQHGPDQQAQQAAQSVLRYFDIAAPLHHDDEDLNLYPALRGLNDSALTTQVERLQTEHDELNHLWLDTRPWLTQLAAGSLTEQAPASLFQLREKYLSHASDEEALLYPHAGRLHEDVLAEIGRAMVNRRRA